MKNETWQRARKNMEMVFRIGLVMIRLLSREAIFDFSIKLHPTSH